MLIAILEKAAMFAYIKAINKYKSGLCVEVLLSGAAGTIY